MLYGFAIGIIINNGGKIVHLFNYRNMKTSSSQCQMFTRINFVEMLITNIYKLHSFKYILPILQQIVKTKEIYYKNAY